MCLRVRIVRASKAWLCAEMFPRCTAAATAGAAPAPGGIWRGDEHLVRPCRGTCHAVTQRCPAQLGFRCVHVRASVSLCVRARVFANPSARFHQVPRGRGRRCRLGGRARVLRRCGDVHLRATGQRRVPRGARARAQGGGAREGGGRGVRGVSGRTRHHVESAPAHTRTRARVRGLRALA